MAKTPGGKGLPPAFLANVDKAPKGKKAAGTPTPGKPAPFGAPKKGSSKGGKMCPACTKAGASSCAH